MQLDLTPESGRVLEEILERALGDLREEIYKSDTTDYKATLREREAIVESLLQRVRTTAS